MCADPAVSPGPPGDGLGSVTAAGARRGAGVWPLPPRGVGAPEAQLSLPVAAGADIPPAVKLRSGPAPSDCGYLRGRPPSRTFTRDPPRYGALRWTSDPHWRHALLLYLFLI